MSKATGIAFRGKLVQATTAFALGVGIVSGSTGIGYMSGAAMAQSNVEVKGNSRIATSTVLSVAAEELSGAPTPAKINAAVQALVDTGFFASVDVEQSGGTLTFVVVENPAVNVVAIEGNKRLKDETLFGVISTQSRQTYSARRAEVDAAAIAQAYAQSGRITATVTPKIIQRSQNRVDLVFQVVEGNVSEIEKITFLGNSAFSERRLRGVVATKQAGLFRAVIQADTFVADRIEFDKQKLREFYLRNGYVDFRVQSATSELTREKDGFLVTYSVIEGQQYRFGDITVVSAEPDIDAAEFESQLKAIKTGNVYRPAKVENVAEELDARASQLNYNFVAATPRISRNDDDRTLDVEFEIARGQRLFVERIDIEGNSTTQDKVIRREFQLAEGDAFNRRDVQQAADRIRGLGYFADVSVEAREGSSPSRAVIDVNVEEKPTGSLAFGLGYGSANGASGEVSIEERNLLGRGQTLRASISTSSEARNIQFGFEEPSFLDRDLLVGFDVGLQTTESSYLPIDTEALTISPKVSFPVSEYGRVTAFYKYQTNELMLQQIDDGTGTDTFVDEAASDLTEAEVALGKLSTSSIGLSFVHDRRNSIVEPTAGYRFEISQEFAGLGGDKRFSKTGIAYKTYRSFLDDQVVVSLELEGGYLKNSGKGSTISDRYFLGGDKLRGFENFGIGPRDVAASAGNDPVGGNTFAVARFEASFPIGLPEEYGIYGGIFFDVGSVWGLDNVPATSNLNDEESSAKIRSAIGFSIFWDTQIGPLRFNFAKPLEYEEYDKTESFRFTVDTRF